MELICLPGSPWTVPLMWSLYYSSPNRTLPEGLTITAGGDPLTDLRLKWMLGTLFPEKPVTLPILFEDRKVSLTESIDMASRFLGDELYPPSKDAEIREWAKKADTVNRFGRGVMLNDGTDNLAEIFLGKIPIVTNVLGSLINSKMRAKYLEGDTSMQVTEVQQILKETAQILESQEFILGGSKPTFVDFTVAIMIEAYQPENNLIVHSWAPNAVKKARELVVAPLNGALDPLFTWKQKFFQTYGLTDDMAEMRKHCKFGAKM